MTPTERALLLTLATSYREHLRDWINGKNPNRRGMIEDTDKLEELLTKLSEASPSSPKPALPTTR